MNQKKSEPMRKSGNPEMSKQKKSKEEISDILMEQAIKSLVLASLDMMEEVPKPQLPEIIKELKEEIRKSIKKAGFRSVAKKIFDNS